MLSASDLGRVSGCGRSLLAYHIYDWDQSVCGLHLPSKRTTARTEIGGQSLGMVNCMTRVSDSSKEESKVEEKTHESATAHSPRTPLRVTLSSSESEDRPVS